MSRSETIDKLNKKAWDSRYSDLEGSKTAATEALSLSEQLPYRKGQAYANLNLAAGYFLQSENRVSLEHCLEAMNFFNDHPDEKGFPSTLIYMGYIYESMGDYERALEQCQKAYQAAVDIAYQEGIGEAQSVLGLIYSRLSDHDRALEAYEAGLKVRQELGDSKAMASSLNRIARSYTLKGEFRKALEYYHQSLAIREQLKDRGAIVWTYLGLASTHQEMGNLDEAKKYYTMILEGPEKQLDNRCKLQALMGIGQIMQQMRKRDRALVCFKEALDLADRLDAKPLQVETHRALADYYELEGEFEKALEHYKEYRGIRETILNDETRNRLKNQEITFAVEKSEKEKEIFQLRNVELKTALDQITESIHYAGRIQAAMLPQNETLEKAFKEHFILFLPRDVVSGDFYWCNELDQKVIFAATDCTGHGVPGALMSMLGISFLNEIVGERRQTEPGKILDILRQEVIKALRQTGREDEQKEGMDMALCCFDKVSGVLKYAGAYNPLYLIRNGELQEFKADRMPVSYYHGDAEPYHTRSIQLLPGDMLYIFSDGFADQFGGARRKKYKYGPFQELLLKIHQEPMAKQKELLHREFLRWKGELEQYDDVLILGIRI